MNDRTHLLRNSIAQSAEAVRLIFCHLVIWAMGPLLVLWLAGGTRPTPLFVAAEEGDLAGIEEALRRGEDVDSRDRLGITPLIAAARCGELEAVRKLLAAGAQIDACADVFGTALMFAVIHGQHDVMRELVRHGADVDAVNPTGQTALWYARTGSNEEAVRILIAGGIALKVVRRPIQANEGDLKEAGAVVN